MYFVEIPTRNIQMSRRHYGLVVKIFAFGYKGRRFESPHVHFHTGDLATCNLQHTINPNSPQSTKTFLKHLAQSRATCSATSMLGGSYVEIPTRNMQMSRHHYGLVIKIFAFGYKGRGFESPHVLLQGSAWEY